MDYTSSKYNIQLLQQYSLWVKTDYVYEHLMVVDGRQVVRYIRYAKDQPSEEGMKLLSLPFERVSLLMPEQNMLINPLELYDENKRGVYQKFLNHTSPENQLLYTSTDFSLAISYVLDEWLLSDWKNIYAQIDIIPEFAVVLETAKEVLSEGVALIVHELDKKTAFCLFNNKNLVFYNSFEVKNETDFRFYLLKIMELIKDLERFDQCIISQQKSNMSFKDIVEDYSQKVRVISNPFWIEEEENNFSFIDKLNFKVEGEA